MNPAPGGRRRARIIVLCLGLAVAIASCGEPAPDSGTPGPASHGPAASGLINAPASPVIGRLTRIDAEGLTRVKGFTLRLDDGREVAFTIGTLENAAAFPPGHLAEHMASSSAVRVFFREDGGALVVYRLEDGE